MNIVCMRAKNVMSISDVEITPGQINQIVGGNSQGKTTLMKILELGFKGTTDGSVVKLGEDAAEIMIELPGDLVIKRRISATGKQSLDVTKDGMKPSSPQAFLNSLFNETSFNPLKVLDPKEREEAILSAIPVSFTKEEFAEKLSVLPEDLDIFDFSKHGFKVIDQAESYYYKRRAEANKDAKDKKTRWETYKADFKEPVAPKMQRQEIDLRRKSCDASIAQIQKMIDGVTAKEAAAKKAQEKHDKYVAAKNEIVQGIDRLKESLPSDETVEQKQIQMQKELDEKIREMWAEHNSKVDSIMAEIDKEQARVKDSEKYIADAKSEIPDAIEVDPEWAKDQEALRIELAQLDAAEEEIKAFESVSKQRDMIADMEKEYLRAQEAADALDRRVELLRTTMKTEIMESAEMPVKGLSYSEGRFLVDDIPIDRLSTSKSMRLSVAVARKLAGKLKVICIDGAEALDQDTWNDFRKEVEGDGYTYLITKVGSAFKSSKGDTVVTMKKGSVVQ